MLLSMHAPSIDLFEWLLQNAPKASYNLAFSNITGLSFEEYQKETGFSLPRNFDLGVNAQYGAEELKDVLSSMYHCTKENIVTTTGASEANYLVFSCLLNPGDDFIIEQPGYQPLWLTPEMLGAHRINWPRKFNNKFRIDVDGLENLITKKTKVIVITNLHNPSGVFSDQKTIEHVAEIAEAHGAYVLIDEIFLDGSFTPHPSSFGIPNVIVSSSITKIYGLGGLHTGWLLAPKELAVHCQKTKAHTTGASSYLSEIMSACVLRSARDVLIERFKKRAESNFEILKKWMSQHHDLIEWIEPDGGIVCFPKYSIDIPSITLCKHLLKTQKILLNPGTYFNQEGHIRLSYGCAYKYLKDALEVLDNGLIQLKSSE
jgi:aspartate/methionine/tyrosine aminotransferase